MKRLWKIYPALFAVLLTAFTVYALLDTFLIRRVYAVVDAPAAAEETVSATETADQAAEELTAESVTTEETKTEWVRMETYRVYNTTIYVADVWLSDPSALRTAFAQDSYGRNVSAVASAIARDNGALLAVNGDNYGSRERGYVIRNGVLYRDTAARDQEDLVIWADGSFSLIREDEVSADELLSQGAWQVFSFGPGLAEDGEILVSADEEVDRAKASNPRTAIGIIEPGHYVLVVSDGRTGESEGLSLYQLAEFMTDELGVDVAYNLDGGGSSTLVYEGAVVNNPTSGGRGVKERAVTDIVYIG